MNLKQMGQVTFTDLPGDLPVLDPEAEKAAVVRWGVDFIRDAATPPDLVARFDLASDVLFGLAPWPVDGIRRSFGGDLSAGLEALRAASFAKQAVQKTQIAAGILVYDPGRGVWIYTDPTARSAGLAVASAGFAVAGITLAAVVASLVQR